MVTKRGHLLLVLQLQLIPWSWPIAVKPLPLKSPRSHKPVYTTGNAVTSGVVSGTNSAPTASAVSITDTNGGSAVVGDSLTGNYTYADIDGDLEGTSTFKWLRAGSPIPGATNTTYTLVAADSGLSITFEVTPVAQTGTASVIAFTSSGITVANSAPGASSVSITDNNGGSAVVGDSLTGSYSYTDIDNDWKGTSTFRWLRGGTPIPGAIDINLHPGCSR